MPRRENGNGHVDRSALLQQRTREFASFYEENAYLAYNLALRITCQHDRAMRATERAFLSVGASESASTDICNAVVATALAETKDKPSAVSGAGGPEAEALLEATAKLSPPERASLALAGLEEAQGAEIAAAMGLPQPAADELLEKALKGLVGELGAANAEDGRERLEGWLWAEPPTEVWESLYPRFYKATQRRLDSEGTRLTKKQKAGGPGPTKTGDGKSVSGRPSRFTGRLEALRRVPVWAVVVVLVLLGLGVVAASQYGGGKNHNAFDANKGPGALPPSADGGTGSAQGALGAKKLDKLRQQELRDLIRQRKRELARKDATKKAGHTKKTSSKRRSAKVRRKGLSVPSLSSPSVPSSRPQRSIPAPTTRPKTDPQSTNKNTGSGDNKQTTTTNPDENCLFNYDQSAYICPQDQSQPTK